MKKKTYHEIKDIAKMAALNSYCDVNRVKEIDSETVLKVLNEVPANKYTMHQFIYDAVYYHLQNTFNSTK